MKVAGEVMKNKSADFTEASMLRQEYPTLLDLGGEFFFQKKGTEVQSEQIEAVSRQLEGSGPLKVAIAQIKTNPSRLRENGEKIKNIFDRAEEQGVDLVVFPELTLPGYASLDNFKKESFVDANIEVLKDIVKHTKGKKTTAIVGFVDRGREKEDPELKRDHYNSAAVIKDGKLIGLTDKTLLPDYDIFWEGRYFKSARGNDPVRINGHRVGIEICEDLWDRQYSTKVSKELVKKGADILINLSASPFQAGKTATRAELISKVVQESGAPFVYANLVGSQDGYKGEVVFDGRSMIFGPDGELRAMGKGFEEDLLIVDIHDAKPIALPNWSAVEETHDALVLGIKDYFKRCGFKKAYVGLSGGIDSAVVAALAVEALGAENVIGVTMPSHITSSETKSDAFLLAENLGIECLERPIEKQYRAWEEDARTCHGGTLESVTKQNAQARMRGAILMEMTNEDRSAIVLSTGNKTELALGYCTLYGDMCGGLAVISDVSKLMVYDLARYYNSRKGKEIIPETTITRAPTAELEEDQTDAENLPADYDILSPLVDDIIENDLSREELCQKYPADVVDRTIRMIQINEYKRRQAAPGIRVTEKAFGAGRRFPIDNKFY